MKDQTIKCEVNSCKHHSADDICKLAGITVTNTNDCKTAHYCYDYCECGGGCKGCK